MGSIYIRRPNDDHHVWIAHFSEGREGEPFLTIYDPNFCTTNADDHIDKIHHSDPLILGTQKQFVRYCLKEMKSIGDNVFLRGNVGPNPEGKCLEISLAYDTTL